MRSQRQGRDDALPNLPPPSPEDVDGIDPVPGRLAAPPAGRPVPGPSHAAARSSSRARSRSAGPGLVPAGIEEGEGQPDSPGGELLQARQGEERQDDLRFQARQPVEAGLHPAGDRLGGPRRRARSLPTSVTSARVGREGHPVRARQRPQPTMPGQVRGRRGSGSSSRRSGRGRRRPAPRPAPRRAAAHDPGRAAGRSGDSGG